MIHELANDVTEIVVNNQDTEYVQHEKYKNHCTVSTGVTNGLKCAEGAFGSREPAYEVG